MVGVFYSLSSKIRPTTPNGDFRDKYEEKKRVIFYFLWLLVFVGVAGVVLFLRLTNAPVKNADEKAEPGETLSVKKVKELMDKEGEEYYQVTCKCKEYGSYLDLGLGWPDTTIIKLINYCQERIEETNAFYELCASLGEKVQQQFEKTSMNTPDVVHFEDFKFLIDYEYNDLCGGYVYREQTLMYDNAIYMRAGGVPNVTFDQEGAAADVFFDTLANEFNEDSPPCQLDFLDLSFEEAYDNYIELCRVDKCDYIKDESILESLLAWFAIVGSVWAFGLAITAFTYGFLSRKGSGAPPGAENIEL